MRNHKTPTFFRFQWHFRRYSDPFHLTAINVRRTQITASSAVVYSTDSLREAPPSQRLRQAETRVFCFPIFVVFSTKTELEYLFTQPEIMPQPHFIRFQFRTFVSIHLNRFLFEIADVALALNALLRSQRCCFAFFEDKNVIEI